MTTCSGHFGWVAGWLWQAITQQARADGLVDTDGLLDLGTRVWEVVDILSARVAVAYHTTERRLVRADEQRLAILWEGLLQGRAVEPGFAHQVVQLLGLPARGSFAVVVSDSQPAPDEAVTWSLEGHLRAVGVRSAWQLRQDVLIGLLSLADSTVDSAVAVLRRQLRGPSGLSLVVQGLGEIGSAHAQAELAQRTLGAAPAGFAALFQRLPEALLLGAPDLAQALVQEWLGPVLRLPHSDRDLLLETLLAWLESAGSAVGTAQTVHCHRNTVVNRVRRIEDLIGHSLHGGVAPLEVLLALRALTVLPSP